MNTPLKTISYSFLLLVLLKLYLLFELTKIRLEYLFSSGLLTEELSMSNLFFERQQKVSYFLLLLYPLFLCFKLFGITCILDTGFTLLKKNIPFQQLLLAVILAEYVYIFPDLIKLVGQQRWLENPYLPYLSFTPLWFFEQPAIPFFLKYLFNSFNLFECIYILLLSYAISTFHQTGFLNNCISVLKTYGIFILGWSLCIGLYLENIL